MLCNIIFFRRLASNRLLGTQYPLLKSYNGAGLSAVTSAIQVSLSRAGESHDQKNERLSRPMSPHLTIYKFEMTSVLSITHRITGCALSVYAVGFGVGALCSSSDFHTIISAVEAWQPGALTLFTAKFSLAFPFMYHTCNGIRHLMWDTGKQLNKHAVITTGSAMLAATLATTILVMCL